MIFVDKHIIYNTTLNTIKLLNITIFTVTLNREGNKLTSSSLPPQSSLWNESTASCQIWQHHALWTQENHVLLPKSYGLLCWCDGIFIQDTLIIRHLHINRKTILYHCSFRLCIMAPLFKRHRLRTYPIQSRRRWMNSLQVLVEMLWKQADSLVLNGPQL